MAHVLLLVMRSKPTMMTLVLGAAVTAIDAACRVLKRLKLQD